MAITLYEFIKNNPVLKNASLETQKMLAQCAIIKNLNPAQILFQHGDIANSVYFILDGQVSICIFSSEGRQLSLNIITEGNIIGEIAVLDGGTRSASAIAIKNLEIASISRQDFLRLVENDKSLSQSIIADLCSEIRRISDKIVSLGLSNLEASLAQILIEHAITNSNSLAKEAILRITQEEIAFIAGVSRVTVNKYLNVWKRKGLINISRGKITIKDNARMIQIIEQNSENTF